MSDHWGRIITNPRNGEHYFYDTGTGAAIGCAYQSKEDAELICERVNGYLALQAENKKLRETLKGLETISVGIRMGYNGSIANKFCPCCKEPATHSSGPDVRIDEVWKQGHKEGCELAE